MRILLTRPIEDCHEMILRFQSLNHEVSHLPLISIEGLKYESFNFSDFKGIIFTSANAIKFLNKSCAPSATATPNKPSPAMIGPILIPHNSRTAANPKIKIKTFSDFIIHPINSLVNILSNPLKI